MFHNTWLAKMKMKFTMALRWSCSMPQPVCIRILGPGEGDLFLIAEPVTGEAEFPDEQTGGKPLHLHGFAFPHQRQSLEWRRWRLVPAEKQERKKGPCEES